MAIYDFQDDLVQRRRRMRMFLAIFIGAYSSFLAIFEIFDYSLRAEPLFSLINSASIFVLIFLFSVFFKKTKNTAEQLAEGVPNFSPQEAASNSIPVIFISDLEKMKMLMEQQFYTQSNLTIGVFAEALGMPEHRLRLLINKHLGYQNFSMFLNSYRIPAAKTALKDPNRVKLSVLTIALELGFGSIGPFNRAFKQTTGLTPSEYRKKIQNRP
jgi:AraC-like DNA-binding protein